jgi:membrane-associated phospholipid phosphatase
VPFLTRYEDDPSRPSKRAALRDVAVRVLPAAVLLWAIVTGVGLLLVEGPLRGFGREETEVNEWLEDRRTSEWDSITYVVSGLGNTQLIIGTCIVAVAVLYWKTRQWWYAAVPALAVMTQSVIFFFAAHITGRERPPVEKLDTSPPTTSYPSGHASAATALYVVLLLLATRIPNKYVRTAVIVLFALMPFMVAIARVYRGMHQPTDVAVSLVNGSVCALLAWNYLRRDDRADAPQKAPAAQTRA